MTHHRLSAPFLIILLIAIISLTLPSLSRADVYPRDQSSVSNQAQTHSVTSKDSQDGQETRTDSKKMGQGVEEPASLYIISLKDETTQAQFDAYKKKLVKQGAVIKYEYSIIKGLAAYIKPSQVSALSRDPLVLNIEKDQEVHTN